MYRVSATRLQGLPPAVARTACYCEPAQPVSAASRRATMKRAPHGGADAAAAAAAATVAPLLQARRAAHKAYTLARFMRALELFERALAAAELALPRDSLIVTALLHEACAARVRSWQENPRSAPTAEGLALYLRPLRLLRARWQAGTLFTPTAEEVAYLVEDDYPYLPAQMCGAYFYIVAALNVAQQVQHFLPPHVSADVGEERLQGLYGALRVALETDARGMLERNPRTGQAWSASSESVPPFKAAVHGFLSAALSDETGLLLPMRATCGLTPAEETALRRLAERHTVAFQYLQHEGPKTIKCVHARHQEAAASDAARHGLRRCALPACDAQEAHPKLFKLCGRCRGAAYCCAAHSAEDWKRHKREDGCKAAP